MKRGASIHYAEIDGVAICILEGGQWCEREAGHDGPHVIAPLIPHEAWERAKEEGQ